MKPQGYARLMTVRGTPPAPWRRLDLELQVAGDLNHDGVADLLACRSGNFVSAISGRDGSVLWRSQHPTAMSTPVAVVPSRFPEADGSPETSPSAVLLLDHRWENTFGLKAISGRNGREIWSDPEAGDFKAAFTFQTGNNGFHYYSYPGAGAIVLESQTSGRVGRR